MWTSTESRDRRLRRRTTSGARRGIREASWRAAVVARGRAPAPPLPHHTPFPARENLSRRPFATVSARSYNQIRDARPLFGTHTDSRHDLVAKAVWRFTLVGDNGD